MKHLFFMLALCAAQPLWADRAARLAAAYDAFVTQVAPRHSVLVVRHNGKTVVTRSQGWGVDQPVILASLSKAITAVCAAELIREGALDPQDTSAQILGHGRDGITVAQLLTHASGLGPDQTQGLGYYLYGLAVTPAASVAKRALNRTSQDASVGRFSYNNENYAVLGEIIAKVSDQPYAQTCRQRVLIPAGIPDARVAEEVTNTLPWGGWEMSVAEYAQFMEWAYGADGVIGQTTHHWPTLALNKWVSYGMGMFQRSNGPGYDFLAFWVVLFPAAAEYGGLCWVDRSGMDDCCSL